MAIAILFSFVCLQYYTLTNSYIRKKPWKYSEGASFGDIAWFKNIGYGQNLTLHGDTIYDKNHEPMALIIKRGYRFVGGNYLLVRLFATNKIGRYCEK